MYVYVYIIISILVCCICIFAQVLVFSLYSAASQAHIGGAASSLPIELKNSFHTLSEAEKALRRSGFGLNKICVC